MKTFEKKSKMTTPPVRRGRTPVLPSFNPTAQIQRAQIRQVLRFPHVQAKLTIGQPNDKYEQEADYVADEVMRMPEPGVQRQVEPEEEEEETLQPKPLVSQITPLVQVQVQRQEEEEETPQAKPLAEQITPLVQRQIEPEEEEEEAIQTKLADGMQVQRQEEPEEEEEEPIQTKQVRTRAPSETPNLASRIESLKGSGQPLPRSVRAFFEPRFGHNFSQVRVHTDAQADKTARAVNARAFTLGRDIVFGVGEHAPNTASGRKLLAHELTHVVQQNIINSNQTKTNLIQRKVPPRYVTCNKYPRTYPIFKRISTNTPVSVIQSAESRAIKLLDNVINELESTRSKILKGEPIARPTVSDVVDSSLKTRFKLKPNNRNIWIKTGAGTVCVLIKRFKAARKIFNTAGSTGYSCLGLKCADAWAYTYPPNYWIYLCRHWWDASLDHQAGCLIHEALHIYYKFIVDTGNLGNAECYEQLVLDLNNIGVASVFAGSCP